MLTREINLPKLHSFFLFGARQTGKTTLLNEVFEPISTKTYNLLRGEDYTRLIVNSSLFREEVLALPDSVSHVIVDEVQRVPELLNEIHDLLNLNCRKKFIITGSSARKLKRNRANLLAGRALNYRLFPLSYFELGSEFKLDTALAFGTLPHIHITKDVSEKTRLLRSYLEVYLHEEIEAEALSRNIGGFIRFLAVAAQTNTEICNFANISRDVQLNPVTVKEYFKIIEDTLIGSFLLPFSHSIRKKHKTSPKFYFFDTGVVRAAEQKLQAPLVSGSFEYGKYFESWFINEVIKINHYREKDWQLSFLRTANDVELDLIIETPHGEVIGIEIKSKTAPSEVDFSSAFSALEKLVPKARCVCVCTGPSARKVGSYEVLPYDLMLKELAAM